MRSAKSITYIAAKIDEKKGCAGKSGAFCENRPDRNTQPWLRFDQASVPPKGFETPAQNPVKTHIDADGGNAGGNNDARTAELLALWDALDDAARVDLLGAARGLLARQDSKGAAQCNDDRFR